MGAGCLVLFGLPFAGVGVFMLWSLVTTVTDFYSAKQWVETPATILSAKLERHRGDKGSVSYKVVAEYRYNFEGQSFTSDRVGINTGFEGDAYDKKKHRQLKKLIGKRDQATCFVNPSDPEQAVLDRALRSTVVIFHLPFVICFGGAGLGMVGGGIYTLRSGRRRRARLAEFPDEPWRVRDDWAEGVVCCGGWSKAVWLGTFALFWNGLSMPIFAIVLTNGKDEPWWVVLLVGLFPLIGLGLLGGLAHQVVRMLRYGRSTFRLANVPGVVGGELSGVVLAPAGVIPDGGYRVTLACRKQITEKSGDKNRTKTIDVWKDTRVVDQTLHDPSGQRGVPVRFVIPSDAKPTDPDASRPISWRLRIEGDVAGPDYQADFDVPVFVTADSRDDVEDSAEPLTDYERVESLGEMLARDGIVYEALSGDSLRISSPPMQNLGTTFMLFGIGVLFTCVGIGVGVMGEGLPRYFITPIATLVGLGMLYGSVSLLLWTADLEINRDRWRLRSGWYGFRGAGKEWAASDVRSITKKDSMSSSSGSETKQWNHVVARLPEGEKAVLVRNLSDRNAERQLIAELRGRAGLKGGSKAAGDDAADESEDGGWSDYDSLEDDPL